MRLKPKAALRYEVTARIKAQRTHEFGRITMPRIYTITIMLVLSFAVFAPTKTVAQDLFIYPTKGQSPAQQENDKSECRAWATRQSGFDPYQQPMASTPPPMQQRPRGGLLRGGARGAALGAVGGAITGDAGKGAAAGAAMGGMVGLMRRNDQRRDEQYAHQQWAQQNAAQYEQNRSTWMRALNACLTGRGYTVQ
jgi:Glycine-zipper domain